MRSGWWVAGAVLASCIWSCDDEPTGPLAGAGIRIILPEGAGSLEGLRVSLRDRPEDYYLPGCPASSQNTLYRQNVLADLDDCEHWSIQYRDLVQKPVRHITLTGSLITFAWDQLNEDGQPVPSGFYYVTVQCMDVDGLTWTGSIMVVRSEDADNDSCTWQLWAENVERIPFRGEAQYAPFPIGFHLGRQGDPSDEELPPSLENPFLVQVQADGMQPFEQQITLTEGKYTDVAVTWVPALPVIPGERGQ